MDRKESPVTPRDEASVEDTYRRGGVHREIEKVTEC